MAREFRVLILNSARRWIGEAAHALALAEGLRQRGCMVLLGVRKGCELEGRARDRGVPVLPLVFNSRFSPVDDWRDIAMIREVVRRERIDLVHSHRGKDHWAAALALRFFPGRRVPLVRTRHVVTPARRHFLNRWLYGHATQGVIGVSGAAAKSLGPYWSLFPPDRRRVIYSAVDSAVFCPERRSEAVRRELGCDENTVLIGLIGRLQRVKGQRYFLEAAAAVARAYPGARFLLAGRGSQGHVDGLVAFMDSIGLARERVVSCGMLANLPEVMASLDVGVIASVGSEGSSRVALEYMASGVGFVATRVGGIPELVHDGAEGLLVAPRDSVALGECMGQLAGDAALRGRLGESGRRTAAERFSPERWLDEVVGVYDAVTSGRL